MEDIKVDKAVKDLIADHERLDGFLTKAHVERLLEKRQLTVEEGTEVEKQLSAIGISIEDESEQSVELEDPLDDSSEGSNPGVEAGFQRLDVRLRNLGAALLSADEEVELGRRMELARRASLEIETGTRESAEHARIIGRGRLAKEAMITANLRLVLHIAKPYVDLSDLSLDDLFQEGVIGLMRGVDKYDHTLGYKFSTYATWWIRQAITRALADRGMTIRLPVHAYDDVLKLKRAIKMLSLTHPTRKATVFEIADELVWPIDKVHFVQQVAALVPASLDERVHGYDDLTLMETLVSEWPSPEDYLRDADLASSIECALKDLKDREREILRLRFGLAGSGDGATLEEIGQRFDVTRERIRQIESKALKRLRHPSRGDALRDFIG